MEQNKKAVHKESARTLGFPSFQNIFEFCCKYFLIILSLETNHKRGTKPRVFKKEFIHTDSHCKKEALKNDFLLLNVLTLKYLELRSFKKEYPESEVMLETMI